MKRPPSRYSLSQWEKLFSQFSSSHFEVAVEAMRLVARERGDVEVAAALSACESVLSELREKSRGRKK